MHHLHGYLRGRETGELRLPASRELVKAGLGCHKARLRRLLLVELRLLLHGLLDDLLRRAAERREVVLVVDEAALVHILLPVVWLL